MTVHTGHDAVERAFGIVLGATKADIASTGWPTSKAGAESKCAGMMCSGGYGSTLIRIDCVVIVERPHGPGVVLAVLDWVEAIGRPLLER